MNTIAPAENILAQIYATIEADPILAALGISSPSQILPRGQLDPATAPRPFLIIRYEGSGQPGPDELELGTYAIDAHDEPDAGDVALAALLDQIKRLFHRARWEATTASQSRGRRSYWAGRSRTFADPIYHSRAATGRFTIHHT